ncbi:hypothetical protein KO527_07660 [Pseudoalteromonas sp. C2R02]|uniref:hypothetical protein n=1 Tax=Pseudoalteromonas sp. C2R02 TaxID=2841565 RepID=UPI001C082D4C|nr:hypothetical protein [Pseudoalteromonas sp. C2R02]MBU2969218.1 hypothetical protein [Pseudoalteromonas sp. C2R02]
MTYTPQGWIILKFTTESDYYFKVFASWREDDRWRLSSGAKNPPELSGCGKYWVWPQESGSCYHLPVHGEGGCSFYSEHALNNILAQSGVGEHVIERVNLNEINSKT